MATTNPQLLQFFRDNYAPGRIAMIGSKDMIGMLIRNALSGITKDHKPSKWSHSFILGPVRDDNYGDGGIYLYESDLHVDFNEWEVINGAQDSRMVKWSNTDIEHACVLDAGLDPASRDALLRGALHYVYAYGTAHFKYPVAELIGTLLAIMTHTLSRRNVVDNKGAVQCATFVRTCFMDIHKDFVTNSTDITNTSPETIWQSVSAAGPLKLIKEWP